jgi:protein-tyrosine kinase
MQALDFSGSRAMARALLMVCALMLQALLGALLWRRKRALRSESELNGVLGVPLIAARPLAPLSLSQHLLDQWFDRGRSILTLVSAETSDGHTRTAAELAQAFARMGVPTLLIDANLRSPALHRAFGLRNRAGLADFLEGRPVRLAHCTENLSVLVAGRAGDDPLELLSRPKLQDFLAAAALRYRVVLVDTPAAARGPDLQVFAAFGGGALVVTRRPADSKMLQGLRDLLHGSRARVVGTVFSPA